ncbi:uclacyanin 1-like [Phoenix dactylifera]|uniref:Uclacyanin 1-like n=1 Tax=Phoenix dactylifera TaxID=42345 RepID=A0A8B7BH18_PHODC|nr:uclacyanin 1-like [Phoenix dactylifera]
MARLVRGYVGVVVGVVVLIAMGCGEGGIRRCEAAEGVLHHVVGGDQGWDAASDMAAWSLDKLFRVGDNLWFTYPAARGSIMELGSSKEFESCDLSNPIRMYSSGLDRVSLDAAGARYFSSGKLEDCRNGLKLHVQVVPQVEAGEQDKQLVGAQELALGPQPSGSSYITASTLILIGLILICAMGF